MKEFIERYKFFSDNFYFECADGWKNLLENLFAKIIKPPKDFSIVQIKEKFGGLRIHVINSNKKINQLIVETEELSFTVCEFCGTTENVTVEGGWIKTLCKTCRDKK